MFSPVSPGPIGCPSACSASITSAENRHSARSRPPCAFVLRCRSTLMPSSVTSAMSSGVFGTPPSEALIWRMLAVAVAVLVISEVLTSVVVACGLRQE